MLRWNLEQPLRQLKSSAVAFLVCMIVALPLIFVLLQLAAVARGDTSHEAKPLPAFNQRRHDNDSPLRLFSEPLISVTFDDGWKSIYSEAMPLLQKYGVYTTQYVLSGTENYPDYMSWKQILKIKEAGHEIACHTINHPDLTTLDGTELRHQLKDCQSEATQQTKVKINHFASPFGSYNNATLESIKKIYKSHRNIQGAIADGVGAADVNLPANFDRYNIIGVTVRRETTVAELQALITYTQSHNAWLVLVYHQADNGPSQYGISPKAIEEQLAYLSSTPLRIVTVGKVIDSLK
jgi:peptidoglycan/xylan/chitin deacetylase (PgdA/CDA1 family)